MRCSPKSGGTSSDFRKPPYLLLLLWKTKLVEKESYLSLVTAGAEHWSAATESSQPCFVCGKEVPLGLGVGGGGVHFEQIGL